MRPRPASPGQPTNVETDHPPEGVTPTLFSCRPAAACGLVRAHCQYAVQRAAALTDSRGYRGVSPAAARSAPAPSGGNGAPESTGVGTVGVALGAGRGVGVAGWALAGIGTVRPSGSSGSGSGRSWALTTGRRRRGLPATAGAGVLARAGRCRGPGSPGPTPATHRRHPVGAPPCSRKPAGSPVGPRRARGHLGRVEVGGCRATGQHRHDGDREQPSTRDAERLEDAGHTT